MIFLSTLSSRRNWYHRPMTTMNPAKAPVNKKEKRNFRKKKNKVQVQRIQKRESDGLRRRQRKRKKGDERERRHSIFIWVEGDQNAPKLPALVQEMAATTTATPAAISFETMFFSIFLKILWILQPRNF